MKKPALISVMLGEPPSGVPGDFASRPPIALVHVACDAEWKREEGGWPRHDGKRYRALIDTGSEAVAMDHTVAMAINATLGGNGIARGFGSRETHVQRAQIQICFPAANLIYCAWATALDFHGDGQTFDLILGRPFLARCELIVNGPGGRYLLTWLG